MDVKVGSAFISPEYHRLAFWLTGADVCKVLSAIKMVDAVQVVDAGLVLVRNGRDGFTAREKVVVAVERVRMAVDTLDYAQWTDDMIRAEWNQPDCPACHEVGMLPTFCAKCGTDRSADSPLWLEYERRFVGEKND